MVEVTDKRIKEIELILRSPENVSQPPEYLAKLNDELMQILRKRQALNETIIETPRGIGRNIMGNLDSGGNSHCDRYMATIKGKSADSVMIDW